MKTLLLVLLIALPFTIVAQIDCLGDRQIKGLRKGQSYIAPCDSMVVLTSPTYRRIAVEKRQLEAQIELAGLAHTMLEDMQQTQDSMLLVYQDQIVSFERYAQTTDRSVQSLQLNLEKSIANTEEAVKIARRNKVLGILLGGAGGLAGGLIIGGLAF